MSYYKLSNLMIRQFMLDKEISLFLMPSKAEEIPAIKQKT